MAAIAVQHLNLYYPLRSGSRGGKSDAQGRIVDGPRSQVVQALTDINFTLSAGDRLGLVGRNGSGKTTLLNVLFGVYPPSSGRVVINGRMDALFNIQVGFKRGATGRRNIQLRGLINGWDARQIAERTEEIIAFSELGEFIDLPLKSYSAGMAARLAFSIATAVSPDILLMDEWIGAGDAAFQEKAKERMQQLADAAGIIVLATHNERLMKSVCNKVLELHDGAVLNYFESMEEFEATRKPRAVAQKAPQKRTEALGVKNTSMPRLTNLNEKHIFPRIAKRLDTSDARIDVLICQELMRGGDWAQAAAYMEAALQSRSSSAIGWSYLAASLGQLHRWAEALRAVERAITAEPTVALFHHQKANFLLRISSHKEALASQAEAVRLDPDSTSLRAHLQEIRRLTSQTTKFLAWGQMVTVQEPQPPGNSIEAIELANTLGYDGIEIDVEAVADGIPVVFHDRTLAKIAGRDDEVETLALEEITNISLGKWNDADVMIPSLSEAFKKISHDYYVLLDIKWSTEERYASADSKLRAARIAEALRGVNQGRILISVYVADAVAIFKSALPGSAVFLKTYDQPPEVSDHWLDLAASSGAAGAMIQVLQKAGSIKSVVSRAHERGLLLATFVHFRRYNISDLIQQVQDGVDYALTMHHQNLHLVRPSDE